MEESLIQTAKALKNYSDIYRQQVLILNKDKNNIEAKQRQKMALNDLLYAANIICSKILNPSLVLREAALALAIKEIGVKELTGNNDGKDIERFQENLSWLEKQAWCCSFVSYCYKEAAKQIGIERPFRHEASVNNFVKLAKENGWWLDKKEIKEADLFVFYNLHDPSKSHIGFVKDIKLPHIITVEGNFQNAVKSRTDLDYDSISGIIRITL